VVVVVVVVALFDVVLVVGALVVGSSVVNYAVAVFGRINIIQPHEQCRELGVDLTPGDFFGAEYAVEFSFNPRPDVTLNPH
jgi:hypothetical protein